MNKVGGGLQSLIPSKKTKFAQKPVGVGGKSLPPDNIPISQSKKESTPATLKTHAVKQEEKGGIIQVEIRKIKSNPHQPRKFFNKVRLQELASSIKEHGILQPLVVTQKEGVYQLIAGERRLGAATTRTL